MGNENWRWLSLEEEGETEDVMSVKDGSGLRADSAALLFLLD